MHFVPPRPPIRAKLKAPIDPTLQGILVTHGKAGHTVVLEGVYRSLCRVSPMYAWRSLIKFFVFFLRANFNSLLHSLPNMMFLVLCPCFVNLLFSAFQASVLVFHFRFLMNDQRIYWNLNCTWQPHICCLSKTNVESVLSDQNLLLTLMSLGI